MIKTESGLKTENVSDLRYLSDTMNGKKNLIKKIIDVFLIQVPEDIKCINEAVAKTDYPVIKNIAHKMMSSALLMGISLLMPILHEMEDLGKVATDIEKIKELNLKLNIICNQAIDELEMDKHNYD